jgi:hypothetical protein
MTRTVDQNEVQSGHRAGEVLDNPAFTDAMESLRAQVIAEWKACPVRDTEGQLLLLQLAKITDKFEGLLRGMVERGKAAQHRIDLDSVRNETPTRQFFRKVVG